MTSSFLALLFGITSDQPCIESIHLYNTLQCTLDTWVVWSETHRKWWRHLWTAPKYEMSLRPTHLSERRMLRTWGSWKLHWRRLSRRERFSWKRGQSFRRDNVEDIKRFKIVRDAIADQFCIFLTLIKSSYDRNRQNKAYSVETDKYTLKSRQFHFYNN